MTYTPTTYRSPQRSTRTENLQKLKTTILQRKFGYLLHQKATSAIPASFGLEFHKLKILGAAFGALKRNWWEEKTKWRYTLRANLHYRLVLKKNTMSKWKLAVQRRKRKLLKYKLAELYYLSRIRLKYFVQLRYSRKLLKAQHDYNRLVLVSEIFTFLHANLLKTSYEFHCNLSEGLSVILQQMNWKKRLQRICFKSLHMHKEAALVKRNNYKLVRLFLKLKANVEDARVYLMAWRSFVLEKKNSGKAEEHLELRLKSKTLSKLRLYNGKKKMVAWQETQAHAFACRSLFKKVFARWMKHVQAEVDVKLKMELAQGAYNVKLMRKSFSRIKLFAFQRRRLQDLSDALGEISTKKLKRRSFANLREYYFQRKHKQHQHELALLFHNRNLLEAGFRKLKLFTIEQAVRRLELLAGILKIQNARLLAHSMLKWKCYIQNRHLKHQKLAEAASTDGHFCKRRCFRAWKTWVCSRKANRSLWKELDERRDKDLLRKVVAYWRKRTSESVERIRVEDLLNFRWDPVCFQRPHVPRYLLERLEY